MFKFPIHLTDNSPQILTLSLFLHTSAVTATKAFNFLLEKCSSMADLKALHAQIILQGFGDDPVSVSNLILGSSSESFQYAHYMFDKSSPLNRRMYNTLIRASTDRKSSGKAILLYRKMVDSGIYPNEFTFPFALKACANLMAYLEGVKVHSHSVKLGYSESHVCVQNGLVNFYVGCETIEYARKVFDCMEFRTVVSWNSMLGGYVKTGWWKEGFLLFRRMKEDGIRPDGHTFVNLLSLCSRICNVDLGRLVHAHIEVNVAFVDVYVQNALLDMYAKCRHLQTAERVFERIVDKNVVSWTSMLSAYARNGCVELAERIFTRMPIKNVVTWNSMISCYLQNGHHIKCLQLFYRMHCSGMIPDETTVVSVLSACSEMGDLVSGKKLHEYLHYHGMETTVTLHNSLIDMYAKCGSTDKALDVFSKMPERNIVSWNTMINALALHGCGCQAIELFQEMEDSGVRPDGATFAGLLSACCHCGLIETGRNLFRKMGNVYKITYDIGHYACMIDILGRGGFLEEAIDVVTNMDVKPDVVVWGALLGACKTHRNVPVAKMVLKQILELEPYAEGGLYVLLSNVFFENQRWHEARMMRKLMKILGARKYDAVSSVDVGGRVYEFMVDDKKHEASGIIYTLLHRMDDHLKSDFDGYDLLCVDGIATT